MKISFALLASALIGMASAPAFAAEAIHIERVIGGVWYGASSSVAGKPLNSNAEIQPGFVRTGSDGSFYGSAGAGTKFRLGPDSIVQIEGIDRNLRSCGVRDAMMLNLSMGKMTASSAKGAGGYEIGVEGGRVCMATGLCVLCMHGDAVHVFVAQGRVTLFPWQGVYRTAGLVMVARPSIAVLSRKGALEIQPLMSAAPGTVNCLTSGASPEIAAHIQEGSPNPANLEGNPPVSEIQ